MIRIAALVTLGFAMSLSPVFGETFAVTFSDTTGQELGVTPFTLGWEFAVSTPSKLTSLDLFDDRQDGMAGSYPIGIWITGGTLIVSAKVDAGTVDSLHDKFRAKALAPTYVGSGTYNIGTLFLDGNDELLFPGAATAFATAAGITFVSSEVNFGSTLINPTSSLPEPGSILLLATVVFLAGMAFRRRQQAY